MRKLTLLAAVILIHQPSSQGQTMTESTPTHPFTVHDLWAMERLSSPQASPDGQWIVYSKAVTDLKANKMHTDLWLIQSDGQGLRRLTAHAESSHSGVFSPDGQWVWFLSGRSGSSQVWKIRVHGGEAEPVTDQPLDVGGFLLSPDGTTLAMVMEMFPDAPTPAQTAARLEEIKKRQSTGQLFDKLFIRHWDTWKDGRYSHLLVMPATGGDTVDLLAGLEMDTPTKPFGGTEEITFAPDSQSLIFTARNTGRAEAWSTDVDIFQVPCDGSAPPTCLTPDNQAWTTTPVFSPDGSKLAYLAMERPGFEADRFRIMLRDWPTAQGPDRALTQAWDRSAGGVTWSKDAKTLYTTAGNLGQRSLFAIDAATGQVKTLVEQGHVSSLIIAGDRILYTMNNLQRPADLYAIGPDGDPPTQITDLNAERLSAIAMGESEQFTFAGWNDEQVYCYVVKPANFDPAKKYPVAFLIHGGPQGSFGNNFHYRWNPQTYTGAGYAAVMVDFHGSTGYGQAFTDSISHHWGDRPLEDLQKGLAAALKRYPWMDGDRVAGLGASYGGYMVNWIAGNWPDRFRCLVNHDGNLCERLAYFDTEELWFPEWEHGGTPWDNPAGYDQHNPIDHIAKWKTPMLVIHGAKDYRVVDTQGISTFTALQRKGIPSKFLYFPDENHWVKKPANGVQWHETVLGWLDQWCKTND